MNLGKAIFARLSSDTGVSALVSNRIYPSVSPDDVYPFVVYDIEQDYEDSISPLTLKEFTVTLSAQATSYSAARALHDAVVATLDGQGGTWGGIAVKGFYWQTGSEASYADSGNAEAIYYSVDDVFKVLAAA